MSELRGKVFWFAIALLILFIALSFGLKQTAPAGGTGMASLDGKAFMTSQGLFFYVAAFLVVVIIVLTLYVFFRLFEKEEQRASDGKPGADRHGKKV